MCCLNQLKNEVTYFMFRHLQWFLSPGVLCSVVKLSETSVRVDLGGTLFRNKQDVIWYTCTSLTLVQNFIRSRVPLPIPDLSTPFLISFVILFLLLNVTLQRRHNSTLLRQQLFEFRAVTLFVTVGTNIGVSMLIAHLLSFVDWQFMMEETRSKKINDFSRIHIASLL
jgi:hypothetical protein